MRRPWPSFLGSLLCALPLVACWAGCSDSSGPSNTYDYDGGNTSVDAGTDEDGDVTDPDASTGTGGGPGFSNDISIIVEPSDNAQGLLDAINAATTSIHMTMYILTDDDVTNALIAKKKAGLDVKVVLNGQFPSDQGNSNYKAYGALYAVDKGMVTYASPTFTFTHEKCVILDGKTAWIMTMNTTLSSPTSNREFLAIDTNADDVAEAEAIFNADFTKTPVTAQGNLLVAPDNAKDRIRGLIGTAKSTVDVEAESFSDFDVVNDLCIVSDNGAKVRVILSDADPSSGQSTGVAKMKGHNIQVVKTHKPYIHAKAIMVDRKALYVGSANFTQNSMENNRELGLVTTKASAIKTVQAAIDTDFNAGAAL